MKGVPQIDQKWWSKNKPLTLKSTGFGKALASYESAVKELEAAKSKEDCDKAYQTVEKLLTSTLPQAAKSARNACNKTLHASAITALDTYVSSTFPAELQRVSKLVQSMEAKLARDGASLKAKAIKINEAVTQLLSDATGEQTKLLTALGGVDKAKQTALNARKNKDDKGMKAAAEQARTGMATADKHYHVLQEILKKADAHLRILKSYVDEAPKEVGLLNTGRDTTLLRDKINSIIDEMGYELKDANKAENELRQIMTGAMDDAKALDTTIQHICSRFEMTHRTCIGTLNQLGGALEKVKFDLMNAKEGKGTETPADVARRAKPVLVDSQKKILKTGEMATGAAKNFREEIKSLAREAQKYPNLKPALERMARTLDMAKSMEQSVKDTISGFADLQKKINAV